MTQLDELVAAARGLEAEPPDDAGARMWTKIAARTAVAAAAATTATAASTAAASTAATTTTTTTAATAATTTATVTVTKVGLGLALVAGLGIGTAYVATSEDRSGGDDAGPKQAGAQAQAQAQAEPALPRPTDHSAAEPGETPVEDEVIVLEEEPAPPELGPASGRRRAKPPKASAPKPEPADALAAESALLARARVSASKGRSKDALADLRRHAKEYPNTALAEVRRALEVRVLCDLGRVSQARDAGKRFVKRHGGSALVGQVRASCAFESDDD